MLNHDGDPGRRYREIAETAGEFARIAPSLDKTTVDAGTLLVRTFDNLWSHRFQPHAHEFDYESQLQAYYDAFSSAGSVIDVGTIIGPDSAASPLEQYRLVVAPMLNLADDATNQALVGYVRQGGTLVLTFRSGTREPSNSIRPQRIPGPFAEIAGIDVEEFFALGGWSSMEVAFQELTAQATLWADRIRAREDDVETIATYANGVLAGEPSIVRRSIPAPPGASDGAGRKSPGSVYYVGCDLDPAALGSFAAMVVSDTGTNSAERVAEWLPTGVEMTVRREPCAGGSRRARRCLSSVF